MTTRPGGPNEGAIAVANVRLCYGDAVILDGISFDVRPGEFVCLTGPSGCGKSTLLRLLGDLISPTSGTITVSAQPAPSALAQIAYVFQSPRLAPWRDATENVMLGMELRGLALAKPVMRERALKYLELVGLAKDVHKFPGMLSGGERQRVSLARAWAVETNIILMDEPFSALDLRTKALLRDELIRMWHGTGKTIVFVTHDVTEAVTLADRIVVFSAKPTHIDRIVEVGLPHPRDPKADPAAQRLVHEITALIHRGTGGAAQAGFQTP